MGLRRLWLHFKIAIAIKREFAFSLFSKFAEPQQTLLSDLKSFLSKKSSLKYSYSIS
jgi:hypothetical protein